MRKIHPTARELLLALIQLWSRSPRRSLRLWGRWSLPPRRGRPSFPWGQRRTLPRPPSPHGWCNHRGPDQFGHHQPVLYDFKVKMAVTGLVKIIWFVASVSSLQGGRNQCVNPKLTKPVTHILKSSYQKQSWLFKHCSWLLFHVALQQKRNYNIILCKLQKCITQSLIYSSVGNKICDGNQICTSNPWTLGIPKM